MKLDEPAFSNSRYYSHPQYYSEDSEYKSHSKQKRKNNSRQKRATSAIYSIGQHVYVKKYNPRIGNFQMYAGEIVSSIDKGFGAISYTWSDLITSKVFKAWEDDIYPSYSAARAALEAIDKEKLASKEIKKKGNQKEDSQPTVTCDNLQNDKSTHDDVPVVSVSPESEITMVKSSNEIEYDACHAVDYMEINESCSDIEQRVNYLEKELTKEKKKRSKLARLGIACLFGG